jgi:aspartyl-tRNA synthetase
VVNPDSPLFKVAEELKSEYVLHVEGTVRPRPGTNANKNMKTGEIEVVAEKIEVLSQSHPLPFDLKEYAGVTEETRLKYRYLDLRRENMAKNLVLRSKVSQVVRNYLYDNGFNEIETPMLTRSTPEGARDFVVPCRSNPGTFYALPQSPQQFKQVLMMSGMDRYFQLARAFRDEELRADRQPEHTQIDMEMSFVDEQDIARIVEGLMHSIFGFLGDKIDDRFPEMEFDDAMLKYGSDKPDLRYTFEIKECSDIFKNSQFKVFAGALAEGGVVRAIKGEGGAKFSRKDMDNVTAAAKKAGAKGLVWLRYKDGKWESPTLKFITEEEQKALAERMEVKDGDAVFIAADKAAVAAPSLGTVRTFIIKTLKPQPVKKWAFLWVRHFPLLELVPETGKYTFTHNPFTAPLPEEISKLDTDPANVKSCQFDLVLNGTELGSGSVRNHRRDIQEKVFEHMGYGKEEARRRFGMIVTAMDYGCPPHGGIGLGFDRLMAIICGTDSIRDVIAFPKTTSGSCLVSEAPSELDESQLKELKIKLDL